MALMGFPLTDALGENTPSRYKNMFNLRHCSTATILFCLLKFRHMHLCGIVSKIFSPHCYKCTSFVNIAAIRWGNACQGSNNDSVYGSTTKSIHPGYSSVERASPTHGGRWLAQTNYDSLMTHRKTESNDDDNDMVIMIIM